MSLIDEQDHICHSAALCRAPQIPFSVLPRVVLGGMMAIEFKKSSRLEQFHTTVDEAIARVVREELERLNLRQRRILEIDEAAEYLGCSCGTIHNLVAGGKLNPVRFDRRMRLDIEDLERLIHESKGAGG
jgi:excisionase family DNA binding protein